MSSTDQEQRLREFFRSQIVPLAERLRERGVEFFPLTPEADVDGYYYDVPSDQPEFIDLDPTEHARLLKKRWAAEGLPELAECADALFELADSIEVDIEEPEVSPAIYVMH